jgi:hypothetical protein
LRFCKKPNRLLAILALVVKNDLKHVAGIVDDDIQEHHPQHGEEFHKLLQEHLDRLHTQFFISKSLP